MRRATVRYCALLAGLLYSAGAGADEYHYKNILIGERAPGLAGAFAAISDDPSGIYYNPAGIIFSVENYFSLSANAYSSSHQTYKNIVSGQDYSYTSQSLIPVFFGFTQTLGKFKLGVAIVVPNSDLIDQNDEITGLSATTDRPNSFKRRLFRQDITYMVGPAIAREITNNFTVGLSLLGFARLDTAIDNQFIVYNPVATGKSYFQNTYITRRSYGVVPKLGVQFMPTSKWAVGATASKPFTLAGSGSRELIATKTDSVTGLPVATGDVSQDIARSTGTVSHQVVAPLTFTLGNAYFFSKTFLLTSDLSYHTGDASFTATNYPVTSVFNWSVGGEAYLSEAFALRGGAYSNNSNTQDVAEGGRAQREHVNLLGGSLGFAYFRPGSSLSLTTTYSRGSGKGQGLGNTEIQVVEQSNLTVYLMGSYQM